MNVSSTSNKFVERCTNTPGDCKGQDLGFSLVSWELSLQANMEGNQLKIILKCYAFIILFARQILQVDSVSHSNKFQSR